MYKLTEEGSDYLKNGLPEKQLIKSIENEKLLEELKSPKILKLYDHDGKRKYHLAEKVTYGIRSPIKELSFNRMLLKGDKSGQTYDVPFFFEFYEKKAGDTIELANISDAFAFEYGKLLDIYTKRGNGNIEEYACYLKRQDHFYTEMLTETGKNGDTEFTVMQTIKLNPFNISDCL